MNLLWLLSDRGTHVRFCWIPSHCGIEGNERFDQLAKETLDHNIDPLANVNHADLKPLVNSYIQQLVQTKWDVAVHGSDLYLNTRATEEIPALNQSWGGCNLPHFKLAIPGPPRPVDPPDCVSPLWSDTDYGPYAPGVYSVTGKSWQIRHSWLIEYSLWDNSWDLYCGILARSGILLPDMNGQTFYAIPHLNNP